ncbi:MAG TPA: cupin domain-containing protein [Ktedonobacterales bacterium]|jgi:mannose-6-phosphate isomerase-like protein (cupin superfamily)|nr:cupin domain-containing protein [Ktedonobacterales bacterium]
MAFTTQIAEEARKNTDFRRVVVTGQHSQVVLMSIPAGGEIGAETHDTVDQTLVFVSGEGEAILDGNRQPVKANTLCFVPAGTRHNFVNTGAEPLQLYTVYAPPQHAPGVTQHTKADADAAEAAEQPTQR